MSDFLKKNYAKIILAISGVSILGSLYFSEILGLPPCLLCWYQRVFMYPLVIIAIVGMIYKEEKIYRFVLPMSFIGLLISFYHNLLYFEILPESSGPCIVGISCTTKYIELLGFITIPFLSFLSFLFIFIISLIIKNTRKKV
ncbi:MAG: disulfide oxidoreductase [bacterium]|nr:disulfide oxidoreductase [bacterium]